jgi:hypothetical protein
MSPETYGSIESSSADKPFKSGGVGEDLGKCNWIMLTRRLDLCIFFTFFRRPNVGNDHANACSI